MKHPLDHFIGIIRERAGMFELLNQGICKEGDMKQTDGGILIERIPFSVEDFLDGFFLFRKFQSNAVPEFRI